MEEGRLRAGVGMLLGGGGAKVELSVGTVERADQVVVGAGDVVEDARNVTLEARAACALPGHVGEVLLLVGVGRVERGGNAALDHALGRGRVLELWRLESLEVLEDRRHVRHPVAHLLRPVAVVEPHHVVAVEDVFVEGQDPRSLENVKPFSRIYLNPPTQATYCKVCVELLGGAQVTEDVAPVARGRDANVVRREGTVGTVEASHDEPVVDSRDSRSVGECGDASLLGVRVHRRPVNGMGSQGVEVGLDIGE